MSPLLTPYQVNILSADVLGGAVNKVHFEQPFSAASEPDTDNTPDDGTEDPDENPDHHPLAGRKIINRPEQ